jgi:hypothetical protein
MGDLTNSCLLAKEWTKTELAANIDGWIGPVFKSIRIRSRLGTNARRIFILSLLHRRAIFWFLFFIPNNNTDC